MSGINKKLLMALVELVEWVKMGDYDPSFIEEAEKAIKEAREQDKYENKEKQRPKDNG
jgi:hypothetical protein